jgi:predicted nucleic acid-binding protein
MKIFYTILIICAIGSTTYAQDVKLAKAQSATELLQSKNTGKYSFVFPTDITTSEIINAADYYKSFFTVQFTETTRTVKVTMIENTPENRRVILRFLASSRIQKVQVGDNQLLLHEFYDQYFN